MLTAVCIATVFATAAKAVALPDNRAFELVSRYTRDGSEAGLNGLQPDFSGAADNGDIVDWQAGGGCCGAASGGANLYQSERRPTGWQTKALTPAPIEPLRGLFEEQAPVFWNNDLSQTIFSTPASYAAGDKRTKGSGATDLYLQGPTGTMTWLSRGPVGAGIGPYKAQFDGATPSLGEVVFGSAEQLTANATGLEPQKTAQYLYLRNVEAETTSLLNVNNSGELLSRYGARLGNGGPPKEGLIDLEYGGTITHAVSADGSKVFFETPPEGVSGLPEGVEPHLYMRDLADDTTLALDDPQATGSAQYEGASANGSLVFFTSDEGLGGASSANELYEFNTTSAPIGPAPPTSAIPLASGAGVVGVAAISNDGSHVFYVASGVLAGNANSDGRSAVVNQPNLYMYDTSSGQTTFVATLAAPDVYTCKPTCAGTELSNVGLVSQPDVRRVDATTPDGAVFVFTSSNDLTGSDHTSTSTLSAPAYAGEHRIIVATTAGFYPRHTIEIGTGSQAELETVEKIDSPTELTVSEYGPAVVDGFVEEHAEGTEVSEVNSELYRYDAAENSLSCVSCTPPRVIATGSATLGETAGGSYAPANHDAAMSEDGSRIFFDSPDPLLPGMAEPPVNKLFEPTNVYEWEEGTVSLIAEGAIDEAVLNGTTPSGDDVFFTTRSQLVPGAAAGYQEIYDARVEGGFPQPGQPAAACIQEACGPLGGQSISFPLPASASVYEPSSVPTEVLLPTFVVSEITSKQRALLARTGHVTLTVSVTAAGKIEATATARLSGKATRVAHATATLHNAGKALLTLTLSRAARAALAKARSLVLTLEVRYSTTETSEISQLALHAVGRHPPPRDSGNDD